MTRRLVRVREELLDGYGLELRKDVLEDFGHPFRVTVLTPGGPQTARFPPLLDVHDDSLFTGDEQLLDTGAKTIASGCPFCMTTLTGGLKSQSLDDRIEHVPDRGVHPPRARADRR